MTLPARVIDYLGTLPLVGGDGDGRPFKVLPWERRFVRSAFGSEGDYAISVARGNGKSAVVAGLACAVVEPDGPLTGTRFEVICVASSFAQSKIIFEDVLAMLRAKHGGELDRATWRVQDSANTATCEYRPTGARVRCIGSDPKRSHGLRPKLVLADEPAQWDPARQEAMLSSLRTSMGKVADSKLIALGTRPARETHWFARMLAGERALVYAATEDDAPFAAKTIRKANPSLDALPSLRETLKREAEDARLDPSMLAAWKALRLNMGTADVAEAMLIDVETYRKAETDGTEREGPYALGIDLGGVAAMSAVSAFWPRSGRLETVAAFPAVPSLADRALKDGVAGAYAAMHRRGELVILGRNIVDPGELVRMALDRWGAPAAIAGDRYREGELLDALDTAAVPRCPLNLRGQGYRDGAEDVRAFQKAMLSGRCRPVPSLLLRTAASEARTVMDQSANAKLAKSTEGGRRARARDDAIASAVVAVAEGLRHEPDGRPPDFGDNVIRFRRAS